MEVHKEKQRGVGLECRGHTKKVNTKRVPVRGVQCVTIQVKKFKVNTDPFLFIGVDLLAC